MRVESELDQAIAKLEAINKRIESGKAKLIMEKDPTDCIGSHSPKEEFRITSADET